MKKLLNFMLAAALICGASVFTSCTKDDNPVDPADNLAEKLIGKWMLYSDGNGQQALTNDKEVITFVSSTKAYVSRSRGAMPMGIDPQAPEQQAPEQQAPEQQEMPDSKAGAPGWDDYEECDVTFEGNTVILTSKRPDGSNPSVKYQIKSISQTDFYCEVFRDRPDGNTPLPEGENPGGDKEMDKKQDQRYTRVTRDYSEAIIGLWECKGLKGGETYNDGNDRLEFFEDGTYKYWRKNDAGEWEEVTTREFQEYFVDGGFLCTRWKNVDEDELREWWEIKSLKGDKMQWKALRQNEDGSTFEQTMDWERVVE